MERISYHLDELKRVETKAVPSYRCPLCRDTGLVPHGDRYRVCACARERDWHYRQKRAGITSHLAQMTFDHFDLAYYDDQKRTENGLTCRQGVERTLMAAHGFVDDVSAGKTVSGLLFQGDVAAGKTFLAAAIANALLDVGQEVLFVVVPDFLDEIRSSYSQDSEQSERALMERVKNVPVLIFDDLGAHNYTEWSIRTLFAIINYRINHDLPMVITTNLTEEERGRLLGPRIHSRLMEACRHYRVWAGQDIRYARRRGSAKRDSGGAR